MLETAAEKGKNLEPWEVLQCFDSLLSFTRKIFIYLAFFTSFTPLYHLSLTNCHRAVFTASYPLQLSTAVTDALPAVTGVNTAVHCTGVNRSTCSTAALAAAGMSAGYEVR